MSTDRELLELAAKAAGIDLRFGENNYSYNFDSPRWEAWNPLTDDGDALRLAVKLRMNFRMELPHAVSAGWREREYRAPTNDGLGPWFWKEWLSAHKDDAVAATRRAIVCAAAEIGKTMP